MSSKILSVLALSTTILVPTGPSMAQGADMSAFIETCRANPDLMPMARNDATTLAGLCECMAVDFAQNLGADGIDLLRRDLSGELTPEDRAATTAYGALSAYAGQTINACLTIEGLVEGEAAPDAEE